MFYINFVNQNTIVMKENLFAYTLRTVGIYCTVYAIVLRYLSLFGITDDNTLFVMTFGIGGVVLYVVAWIVYFIWKNIG